jgi:hypothetical protein
MKKIIRLVSFLSLLVLFSAASTFGQSHFGIDVNIPFAFNVADHAYDPGNYIVKFERHGPGLAATLSIQDTKTDEVQTIVLSAGGDPGSEEIKLVFDTVEGRRYLRKVRTQSSSYAIAKTKTEKNLAKGRNQPGGVMGETLNSF